MTVTIIIEDCDAVPPDGPSAVAITQVGGAPLQLVVVPAFRFQVGSVPTLVSGPCVDAFPAGAQAGIGGFFVRDVAELTTDVVGVVRDVVFANSPWITTLNMPSLTHVGRSVEVRTSASLTSVDFSALVAAGNGVDFSELQITSLDLASLQRVGAGGLGFADCPLLTTVDLSGLLSVGSDFFSGAGCALTEATVDAILVRFAALDGTAGTTSFDNGTIDLSGGTNAPPSATGLAAKTTLEGRGNTVLVNV